MVTGAVMALLLAVPVGGILWLSVEPNKPDKPGPPAPPAEVVYQETLAAVDSNLGPLFAKLGQAGQPLAVKQSSLAAAEATRAAGEKLAGVTPPGPVAEAHKQFTEGLAQLAGDLSTVATSPICANSAGVVALSRAASAEQIRTASAALRTVDPSRGYVVGGFLPEKVTPPAARPANGTVLKPAAKPGTRVLEVRNGGTEDLMVLLAAEDPKVATAGVFVQAGASAKIEKLPFGTYRMFLASGTDWDEAGAGFTSNCRLWKFEKAQELTANGGNRSVRVPPTAQPGTELATVGVEDFPVR
ncbi:hypothetical protein [Virgisporangium aliadipatigenens]|uniref:hypothetical protein n=1 Tax=Virgisporangium aliadipatigenens TaxID=741659 RepID=UPI0019423E8E|nr:hypothetical protein [Virgisporangium aliadipatigenens]